jgi:hypothetical protein
MRRVQPLTARALASIAGMALLSSACGEDAAPPSRLSREALLDPDTCSGCHREHYRDWAGSMHAYAADDPVFLAMNQRGQRETGGRLGSFCVNCHAPMAVREGLTEDGLNLAELPRRVKGVTCYFCHSVAEVNGSHDNPLKLADDGVMRGAFSDSIESNAHGTGYSALHDRDQLASARLCGACHDIVTSHGAAVERTFSEWQASVFSASPGGSTCGQCHMPQSTSARAIALVEGAPLRRTHGHALPGVDVALTAFPEADAQRSAIEALLATTIQSAVCVGPPLAPKISVILDNVAAGHSWPSGAVQDRRAWVEVMAYRGDDVVYQSGVVPEGVAATEQWRADPDMWLMRDCIFDDDDNEVHMFWQAASFETNVMPVKATFSQLDPRYYQNHLVKAFPASDALAGMPDRVTVRVKLSPVGLDVIDDLIGSGDLDPTLRERIPTFTVGRTESLEWTLDAVNQTYTNESGLPIQCVSNTNLNAAGNKVPAPEHTRCRR